MKKIRHAASLLRGFFPSALPTKGMNDFDTWSTSIFEIYQLPDLPSYRHAIATCIMHLGPLQSHASKAYFARCIRKAMANQIAFEKIQQINEQEKQKDEVTSATPEEEPLIGQNTH